MIHEEICTYEVCKLAKEKGFNVKEIECWHYEYDGHPTKEIIDEQQYPNITQSLLQRWLREECDLHICIGVWEDYDEDADRLFRGTYPYWSFNIQSCLSSDLIYEEFEHRYNTYELALEDALKYVLENLI